MSLDQGSRRGVDDVLNNMDSSDNAEQTDINEFKKSVVSWVSIDDMIRKTTAELKKLKTDKKNSEQNILKQMDKINLHIVGIGQEGNGGKLRKCITRSKGALKQSTILECLLKLTKDQAVANKYAKYISESRPIVEKPRLKRTFARKK